MKINLLFLVIFLSAAVASSASCIPADLNTSTGKYDYYDGLNLTHTGLETFYPDEALINSTIQTKMWGETGLTILEYIKYEDAIGARGMAVLAINPSGGGSPYRAFYQFDDEIWSIPYLSLSLTSPGEYSNGQERVYWSNISTENSTTIKYRRSGSSFAVPTLSQYHWFWKFGNDTIWYQSVRTGPTTANFSTAAEGYIQTTTNAGGSPSCISQSSGMTEDTSTWYNWGCTDTDRRIEYYGCEANIGDLVVYAYEGSEECGAFANVPSFDCEVLSEFGSTDSCSFTTGTNLTTNGTVTAPRIYEFTAKESDGTFIYYAMGDMPKPGHYCEWTDESQGEGIDMYMTATTSEAIHIRPEYSGISLTDLDLWEWINSLSGTAQVFENGERMITGTYKYASPVDPRDMNVSEITFYDTPISADICSSSAISWEFTAVLGYNESHYLAVNADCDGGSLATTNSWVENVTAAIGNISNPGVMVETNCIESIDVPIAVNIIDSTIDRYFLYWYDLDNFRTDGNLGVIQDTLFEMTYNYTVINEQNCTIEDLQYANYSYFCVPPANYSSDSFSGEIEINKNYNALFVPLQADHDIYIQLNVTDQGGAKAGIKCIGEFGISSTNSSGICIFRTSPDEIDNITLSHAAGYDDVSFSFEISDFYNSDRFGDDGEYNTCESFDFIYKLSYDYATPDMVFWLGGSNTKGNLISNVQLYVDNETIGSTGAEGKYFYKLDFDAISHELLGVKSGWTNGSGSFDYRQRGEIVTVIMHPDSEAAAASSIVETGDYSNLPGVILSPFLLSMIAIGALVVVGAVVTTMIEVGMILGLMGLIVALYFGAVPFWFGIGLCLALAAIVWAVFTGVF